MPTTLNDIPENSRKRMQTALNTTLAELTDLTGQLQNAHWNVRGPLFFMFHELFGKLYDMVSGHIDTIAERCAQLGGIAAGTIQEAVMVSGLRTYPHGTSDGAALAGEMALRVNELASATRKLVDQAAEEGDQVSSQLLIDVTITLDKALWFLESHAID